MEPALAKLTERDHGLLALHEVDAGSLREVVRLPGIEETFYALTFQRQFQSPVAEELIAAASHWPA